MNLDDRTGVFPDGRGVVGEQGAVGRADLPQLRAGRGKKVGEPEAVAYLYELASADHQLPAGAEHGGRQDEGRRAVVDDQHILGVRDGVAQRREGAAPRPARRPVARSNSTST